MTLIRTVSMFGLLASTGLGCSSERAPAAQADSPVAAVLMSNPIAWAFDAPSAWDDRVTMEDESVAPGAQHHSARAFLYAPADTSVRPQALLAVLVYDSTGWSRLAGEGGPPPGDTIMTREGRVYVASLPQSNPFQAGSRDALAFDSMAVTIDYVRGAFRLVP
jgi:hypothetical protein